MRVEIVALCATGDSDICVTFLLSEGPRQRKESFVISPEAYADFKLCKGESSCEVYDAIERESRIYYAFKRGISSLGYGLCSSKMLISKLRTKGIAQEDAAEAVNRIVIKGYLDEAENAKREAEVCAAKLWGESRIRAKLIERRYSAEAIDSALFHLEDSGVDFDESCKTLIDKTYARLPADAQEMRKLISAMSRRGYSISQIKAACLALRDKKNRDMLYK